MSDDQRLLMDCVKAVGIAIHEKECRERKAAGLYEAHPEISDLPFLRGLEARLFELTNTKD